MRSLRVLLTVVGVCSGIRAEGIYSVCQLLQAPLEHTGQLIRVRGIYSVGPEASAIGDQNCREMLAFDDTQWEPDIWLSLPGEPGIATTNVPFDAEAYKRLVATASAARSEGKVVRATFEGLLRYCPAKGVSSDGQTIWTGCGAMGWYPLALILKTVTDLAAEPNPWGMGTQDTLSKDPILALWVNLRSALTRPDGSHYFVQHVKGAMTPPFTGRLVSAIPSVRPTRLVLSVRNGTGGDAILFLNRALPGKAKVGTLITFKGVPQSYTRDPFAITFRCSRDDVSGWPEK